MDGTATRVIETDGVAATEALGAAVAAAILADRVFASGAALLLSGPLGAGKTAFVRGLARGLGAATTPKSPTFALQHTHEGRRRLQHFDLYRLAPGAMIDDLGLDELFDGPDVTAVEWAERLEGRVPAPALVITFEPAGDDRRRITITGPAARIAAIDAHEGAARC